VRIVIRRSTRRASPQARRRRPVSFHSNAAHRRLNPVRLAACGPSRSRATRSGTALWNVGTFAGSANHHHGLITASSRQQPLNQIFFRHRCSSRTRWCLGSSHRPRVDILCEVVHACSYEPVAPQVATITSASFARGIAYRVPSAGQRSLGNIRAAGG